ncbi:hypothetical protein [Brevibacillus daliensis]|uniref:hypothetical protein n=1 Tax=Brevibacillus daliensis TaxID=2892995 RepID=UPI001E53A4E8|nr:hypothetical protein [Brevibacillus daliensis]
MMKRIVLLLLCFLSLSSVAFAQPMVDIVTNFINSSDGRYNWSGAEKNFVKDKSGENLWVDVAHLEGGRLKIQVVAPQWGDALWKLIVTNTSVPEDKFLVKLYVGASNVTEEYYELNPGQSKELNPKSIGKGVRVIKVENANIQPDPDPEPETPTEPKPKPQPEKPGDTPLYNVFDVVPISEFWGYLMSILSIGMPFFLIFAVIAILGWILPMFSDAFQEATRKRDDEDDDDDDW